MIPLLFKQIASNITSILITILSICAIYVIGINIYSYTVFRPESVINTFTSLIENPTQTVTEQEKSELQSVTQTNFFTQWAAENNIKVLRRISQNNPIQVSEVEYIGEQKRYATVTLTFDNDLKNENSKEAVLYLEQYGSWFTIGRRWRIYQIDMPEEDTPFNTIQDTQDSIRDGFDSTVDSVKEFIDDTFN